MFGSLKNKLTLSVGLLFLGSYGSAMSMEIYTVQSNDYLYKIAKKHPVSGVSTLELTDAIKGINKSEIPGIVSNRIGVGDKLAIPTTSSEVEDGLLLLRNQQPRPTSDSTYEPRANQVPDVISDQDLGDRSMMSSTATTAVTQSSEATNQDESSSVQHNVPNIIYSSDNSSDYSQNVVTQSKPIQESVDFKVVEDSGSSTNTGNLFRFILMILVLGAAGFFGKKIWVARNDKKEHELEQLGKRKRDHLMSRISPVVDTDFYKTEQAEPQSEFDFFNEKSEKNHQDSANNENVNMDDGDLLDGLEADASSKSPTEKNVVIKTEKGVVFETSGSVVKPQIDDEESQVEESDYKEQEQHYVMELVEQYLDSEKFIEASITLQDSLENDPNNVELRYRLLEVYAKAGDEIAFDGEVHFIRSKALVSMFDPFHQKIAKLRSKYFE